MINLTNNQLLNQIIHTLNTNHKILPSTEAFTKFYYCEANLDSSNVQAFIRIMALSTGME